MLPFEFRHADQPQHPADRIFIVTASDDILGGLALLNVQLQNLIQQIVRRQAVLIGLIGAQLSGGCFGQNAFRNVGLRSVPPARDAVDHHLRQIRDDRQTAVHVAVERAISHRDFRLVASGQQQRSELVGERHQQIAANARLDVFFRDVGGATAKRFAQHAVVSLHDIGDRQSQGADAEVARQSHGILNAAAARIARGHQHAQDVVRAYGFGRDGCGQRRIDGAYGYNPEGVRIGQDGNRNFRAVKVWDRREFKDLDDDVELGTRNIKIALRRLRKFARTGAPDELDLDGTIKGTAHKGYLDIHMRPERHNAVKVLLFFDIGGSMDWHIKATEELFSAARTEFKHMEHFYFHNCLYERVWKENRRRFTDRTPTWDVLHKYPHDYKVVFVGDASMSPYEIMAPGGSVEHVNEEAGSVWLERITRTYPHAVWLNPVAQRHWDYSESTTIIRRLFSQRMYPITIEGLESAMRELVR